MRPKFYEVIGFDLHVNGRLHFNQRAFTTRVSLRIFIESVLAAWRTEIISFTFIFRCPFSSFWIDFHLADGISFHRFSLRIKQV
jgi:hypothetical protein